MDHRNEDGQLCTEEPVRKAEVWSGHLQNPVGTVIGSQHIPCAFRGSVGFNLCSAGMAALHCVSCLEDHTLSFSGR